MRAFKYLAKQQYKGEERGRVAKEVVCIRVLSTPYINTALTGANLTAPQSRRRKSPAAWDSHKMTFYSEYLRDHHGIKASRKIHSRKCHWDLSN